MDEFTYIVLDLFALDDVNLIKLEDFEYGDEDLEKAKKDRSVVEYYFTCTPSLPLYILKHWPEVNLITYLDADLYFFASPTPLFQEMGLRSIGLIAHRFPPRLRHLERTGIYNVGWLSFRRDPTALEALTSWRHQCLEWCYDRTDDGRYGDQKYLDDWPERFSDVAVLQNQGANVAPWNIANQSISIRSGPEDNAVLINGQPIIFFHFQGVRKAWGRLYIPGWRSYQVKSSSVLRKSVYLPYLQHIEEIEAQLSHRNNIRFRSDSLREKKPNYHGANNTWTIFRLPRTVLSTLANVLWGNYVYVRGRFGK